MSTFTEPTPKTEVKQEIDPEELKAYLQRLVDNYNEKLTELESRIAALEP